MPDARPLLRELLGGPVVAYHPRLAHFVGGVKAAVFLSQLYYLSSQRPDPDAAFDMSVDALEASTGLSVKEQASARDELLARHLIVVTRRGMPRRYFYRVALPALVALIAGQLPLPGVPSVSPQQAPQSRQKGDTGVAPPETHESPDGRIKSRGTKKRGTRASGAAPRPPAVVVLTTSSHRTPHRALWPMIDKAIGSEQVALDRWREIIETWCAKGYNRTNVFDMLNVFAHGWTRGNGSKPNGNRPGPGYDAGADVAAHLAKRAAKQRQEVP